MRARQRKRLYEKYKIDLTRLAKWLMLPRQGIVPQVIGPVIEEVGWELLTNKKWYRDCLVYEEGWRHLLSKDKLPERFWIENYVLRRCRWVQEDLLEGGNILGIPDEVEIRFRKIEGTLKGIEEIVTRVENMVAPIKRFLSVPDWMKRSGRKLWTIRLYLLMGFGLVVVGLITIILLLGGFSVHWEDLL